MKRLGFCWAVALAAIAATSAAQTPLGTAFTYQGQLKQSGSPYNGQADMVFELYDASSGGNVLGTDPRASVPVTNGLFTVEIDFGSAALFNGSARWLAITVNGTPLTPRQPITPTPYALQTRGIHVADSGAIGIRTTDPQADLHIDGAASGLAGLQVHAPGAATGDVFISGPAGSVGIVGLANNGHRRDIRFTDAGLCLYTRASGSMPLEGNGLFVDELGQVGIGTITPGATLDVAGSLAVGGPVNIALGALFVNQATRRVGINTTSPASVLHVVGRTTELWPVQFGSESNANETGMRSNGAYFEIISYVGASAFARLTTSGQWTSISDGRLKTDAAPVEGSLAAALRLRPTRFRWLGDGRADIGFVAQEVRAVLPELVTGDESTEMLSVSYPQMAVVAIGALQELKREKDAQIDALRAANRQLADRLARLEALVERLAER